MAQQNIEITLPVSEEKAVLKGYIPHKVSRKIQEIFIGQKDLKDFASAQAKDAAGNRNSEAISAQVDLTGKDMLSFQDVLVKGLVIQLGERYSVDGGIDNLIDELPEVDFSALSAEAMKLWERFQEKSNPKELPSGNSNTNAN